MRILLDAMLGGLRSYLRICGHDTAYALDRNVEDDERLLSWASEEDRLLCTRDRQLAARADRSLLVESHDLQAQLDELRAAGVDLSLAEPPTRCGRCNGRLDAHDDPSDRPEYVPDHQREVWRCRDCGQYFWKGSHWEAVRETLSG